MGRNRVLVLAIDAANPDLLVRWAGDGTLPHLGALIDRGVTGRTRGVRDFYVGATWPSFYTGCTPARHGVHYGSQILPGTYRLAGINAARSVKAVPFWRPLAAGRSLVLMDVPFARLDPSPGAELQLEWGCHDLIGAPRSNRLHAVLREAGPHPLPGACDGARQSLDLQVTFREALVRGAALRGEITGRLMRESPWDVLVQVFSEAHCAGHQSWHLHDRNHPGYDERQAGQMPGGPPLRRVYQAIDAAIGSIVAQAGDATILVVVPHGMSFWFGAEFLLTPILLRLGYAAPPSAPPRPSIAHRMARRLWQAFPESARSRLRPWKDRLLAPGSGPSPAFDPARSRCFRVNNGLAVGGVRLNLKGREPEGVVAPGTEADLVLDQLTADLLELVDERTGKCPFQGVVRTRDSHVGPEVDALPDLLVEWSDTIATGSRIVGTGAGAEVRFRSPKLGVLEGVNDYCRSGEHRPDGMFIAAAPWLAPGTFDREVSLLDLAPTIAALGGAELPGCEGKPIVELLDR